MSFKWMKASEFNEKIQAKDREITEMKKKLDEKSPGADNEKLKAMFGDRAKAADFDLEAEMKKTIEYAEGLESDLETAKASLETAKTGLQTAKTKMDAQTAQLNGIAKWCGLESAEGVDLVEAVGKLEPENRTKPTPGGGKPKVTSDDSKFLCEYDMELQKMLKDMNIDPIDN